MAFLDLDRLDNLQELKRLDELQQMQHLNQLQNLDKLQDLEHMDQLQNLDKLQDLQHMDQLQNLDKLQGLQHMEQLQNLDKLQHMTQMQHLNSLNQLSQMKNLQEIQKLDLSRMQDLNKLEQLQDMQYMSNLGSLKSLDKLQVLENLKIFERLFQLKTLLYLLSLLVPGFIFQEVVSLLLGGLSLKRGLAIMTVYNILNLFICMVVGYDAIFKLEARPFAFYGAWFAMLVLIPALLGWFVAWLTPYLNRLFSNAATIPTRLMTNKWGEGFGGLQTYQITITMNNEEKIRGTVTKAIPSPAAVDPGGLYLTETSHYNPEARYWQDLEQPTGVWVKGTEIKMMEVSPEAQAT